MKRKFPNLFSPIKIGGVTLKNRIISAPMAYPVMTADGCLTSEAAAFYELRAKGGAAVVTVSEAIVHSATGKSHAIHILLDAPNARVGLSTTARAIKRHGAIPSIELSHGGKYASADKVDKSEGKDILRYGPSEEIVTGGAHVQEMPKSLIREIIASYGKGAALCKEAGFEMILIHAGHGWLMQQFLSPSSNKRTDEYGGSFENRSRFLMEVIDIVRANVGPNFPLELRISAEEYVHDGYSMDEVIKLAKLVESKIDLLQVSTGSHEGSFDKTHPSMFMERGVNVHYAAEIKKHVKIPVSTVGALNEPQMMEDIIASGKADIVEMARALLADPYLPKKALTGHDDEIVRCCRCFTCMAERMTTGLRICAFNPLIGNEYESKFTAAPTTPKKVLIAGGGPGGMQAAITAAQRGHSVTLCEKTGLLGGALNAEKGISFKKDLYGYIAVKSAQMYKEGVSVLLNTEVTPELAEELSPDILIVAVGAEPFVPPLPGINSPKVIIANQLPENHSKVGQKVVILGGGLVGCETAVYLAGEGKDVTVIEMLSEVCLDANGRHRPLLLAQLNNLVKCRTNMCGLRITDEGIVCSNKDGKEELFEADTIICSVGQRSLRNVAAGLRDCAPEVIEIGDCVRPACVTEAVFRGYNAGLDI